MVNWYHFYLTISCLEVKGKPLRSAISFFPPILSYLLLYIAGAVSFRWSSAGTDTFSVADVNGKFHSSLQLIYPRHSSGTLKTDRCPQ